MCVFRQGCALHLQRPQPEPEQQQQRAFRGMAGRCRSAGTPQVRPCRLGSRIHAADTPHSDTAPSLTDFRDLMDPRHAWMNLHRVRTFRQLIEEHPRMAWIYRVDQGRHPPTAPAPTDRRKLSKAGWVRLRGREPHGCGDRARWTDSRRPPQPDPPRHPSANQLLLLLLLLLLLWIVAGAGRSPANPLPLGHRLPPLRQQLRSA